MSSARIRLIEPEPDVAAKKEETTTNSKSWMSNKPAIVVMVILAVVALFGFAAGMTFQGSESFFANTITAWSEPMLRGGGYAGIDPHDVVPPPPKPDVVEEEDTSSSTFRLLSTDMNDGGNLPYKFTCMADDGVGESPPFYWENVPAKTTQFFLMMETDAYKHDGTYLYTRDDWTIYNIPATTTSIESGNSGAIGIRGGTYPGTEMHVYNPPCPFGSGNKTYYFTIYAVSTDLGSTICPTGTYVDTTTTPNTLRCNDASENEIGINMAAMAESLGVVTGSASLAVSFCMYSDSAASCAMGNYLRHKAQRPNGAGYGDVFDASTGGGDQDRKGAPLAKEVYSKAQFHMSAAAKQGQMVDDDALGVPPVATVKQGGVVRVVGTEAETSSTKKSKTDKSAKKSSVAVEEEVTAAEKVITAKGGKGKREETVAATSPAASKESRKKGGK